MRWIDKKYGSQRKSLDVGQWMFYKHQHGRYGHPPNKAVVGELLKQRFLELVGAAK